MVRNQEIGCLLRGVAGCAAGLLLRDTESFKGLPDLRAIVDREDKFTLQPPEYSAQLSTLLPREDTVAIVLIGP